MKRRKDREFFDAQEIFPWISHYSPSSQEICFFHSSSIPSCKFTPISGVCLHLPIFKVHRNCSNWRLPCLINQLKLSENTFLIKITRSKLLSNWSFLAYRITTGHHYRRWVSRVTLSTSWGRRVSSRRLKRAKRSYLRKFCIFHVVNTFLLHSKHTIFRRWRTELSIHFLVSSACAAVSHKAMFTLYIVYV